MSELEGDVKIVFPPPNLHVSVTVLTTVDHNDLVPYRSSPLHAVLSVGHDCILFITFLALTQGPAQSRCPS